ncbi:MAG: sigma-70 family RNA polymerase sigma factor [Myxococcales bacterium]|nr:sigma-70 family RNA polymerase sigma factor [Myxococcales bacterium]
MVELEPETTLLALRLHEGDEDEPARILAARDGDESARSWLVERWTPPVWRFCRRMLMNDEDAGDAAQETLVKVLRNLDRYDPDRSFSTWVFGIARNTCIDEHRRRRRRAWDEPGDIPDTSSSPLQDAARSQRAELLEHSLMALPPMYREILVLYHFEHRKYTEIAEILELPLGTVMNRIFRARKKLRTLYEENGGDQP